MEIIANCWFKFFDGDGLPCIVLLDDIVSVFTLNCYCYIKTVHGEYLCGDSVTTVIKFLSIYFNSI